MWTNLHYYTNSLPTSKFQNVFCSYLSLSFANDTFPQHTGQQSNKHHGTLSTSPQYKLTPLTLAHNTNKQHIFDRVLQTFLQCFLIYFQKIDLVIFMVNCDLFRGSTSKLEGSQGRKLIVTKMITYSSVFVRFLNHFLNSFLLPILFFYAST